jgi:hypothetical protein
MEAANYYSKVFSWLLLSVFFVHAARADQVSYTNNTPSGAYMPWTNTLQMPQFSQPFARLDSISYSLLGEATEYVNVHNGGSGNEYVTAIETNYINILQPDGSVLSSLNFSNVGIAVVLGNQSKSILVGSSTNLSGALAAGAFPAYIGSGSVTFTAAAPAAHFFVSGATYGVSAEYCWGDVTLTLTYSFTPLGLTQQTPILPTSTNINNSVFTAVPSGDWFGFAPSPAVRFDMTTPGAAFTGILGFPTNFSTPFTVSTNGISLGQFSPGQTLSFGPGVQSFTISNSSAGYPLELAFTPTNASFTMTPIVPLQAVVVWGNAYAPTPTNLQSVAAIGTGWYHCFVRLGDGSAELWGYNNYNDTVIPTGLTDMVAMAGGQDHTIVLHGNGTADAWGEDVYGECDLQSGLQNIVAVAAGTYDSYVLTSDGYVYGWGDDTYGQVSGALNLYNIIAISSLVNHGIALGSNGSVQGWGDDSYGQIDIPSGLSGAIAVAAGSRHSMALLANGNVVVWGDNTYGQTNVPPGLSNVVAIAAGFYHCLALRNDGTVVAWGWNNYGQTNVPAGLSNVVAIAAGGYQSLALLGAGLASSPAIITNVQRGNGVFSLTVPTERGKSQYLEHADTLNGGWWTPGLPVPGDGTVKTLTDYGATGNQRFYRVWRKP